MLAFGYLWPVNSEANLMQQAGFKGLFGR